MANDGIAQKQTGLSAGANYVARVPISYEDRRARPRIRVYDDTNGASIVDFDGPWLTGKHDGGDGAAALAYSLAPYFPVSLVGGTVYNITDSSSATITAAGDTVAGTLAGGTDNDWDDGDEYMIVPPAEWVWCEPFCWELPTIARNGVGSDCTAMSFQMLNINGDGLYYAHQAEVQSNLVDNPSLETGAGDPWVPDGWTNKNMEAGDSLQETTIRHSGSGCMKVTANASNEGIEYVYAATAGHYYLVGNWVKLVSGSTKSGATSAEYQSLAVGNINITTSSAVTTEWTNRTAVGRVQVNKIHPHVLSLNTAATYYADDIYQLRLTDVSLTATPASEANSTESSGLRVDGLDTLTQPITEELTATSGIIRFGYTPRHDAADAVKFGNTTVRIALVYNDGTHYIALEWSAANTISLKFVDISSTTDTWDATGAIVAGTTYQMVIAYTATSCTLSVDGVVKATATPGGGIDWGANIPDTIYWGTSSGGTLNADSTYSAPA